MKLSEFFDKAHTKNIVINTDIDGFLSGMLLQKYYGCRVVGFSNSRESIWLVPEIKSIYEPIYIDIFVNNPDTYCIDQHIVAYGNNHLEWILASGTKLNPNLDILKKTYTTDYYHKYPFGTVHYLIALMKLDGIDVDFNELEKEYVVIGNDKKIYRICPGQVILRADDALNSSLGKYAVNASEWWRQLKKFNSSTIDLLYDYIYKSCKKDDNEKYKENMKEFFINGLDCDGADGAFVNIISSDNKSLQKRVLRYNEIITQIVGMELELPKEVKCYKGIADVKECSQKRLEKAVTYAFIYGPTKADKSFSFTIDIE